MLTFGSRARTPWTAPSGQKCPPGLRYVDIECRLELHMHLRSYSQRRGVNVMFWITLCHIRGPTVIITWVISCGVVNHSWRWRPGNLALFLRLTCTIHCSFSLMYILVVACSLLWAFTSCCIPVHLTSCLQLNSNSME